jgi:hypothetical protein
MSELLTTDLTTLTTVELRKLAAREGVKGMSSARKADLLSLLGGRKERLEREAAEAKAQVEVIDGWEPKKGSCEDCGRKVGKSGHPTLCTPCFDYAGWENTHSDSGHDVDASAPKAEMDECPVCHPELDPRKAKATGRSRAGMVIVAKGSEIHKSQIFKEAAEAAGWTVTVTGESYGEDEVTRYYADAHKGDEAIQLAWDGRAYDYAASSARINGKDRKIRNLKEALRVLAA